MDVSKKVSVIIPNYNYAKYVRKAIESVLLQTYSNLEVIVVNNGSTDDSLQVLKEFGEKIELIDQSNLGQSGARNSGLRRSTGDLIAFLDADDFWEPTKLEKQIALINEDVQLVYCGISTFDETITVNTEIALPIYKGNCSSFFLDYPAASVVLSGESTAVFTKLLLEKVGAFDPELNSSAGWDFFRRASAHTNFDFVPAALTYRRAHSENMSNSDAKNILDIRRAYKKLFREQSLMLSRRRVFRTKLGLEWSFVKTYLRKKKILPAFAVASGYYFITSY
jgi:glycosyltransferase involved in cell wall biosynthesis